MALSKLKKIAPIPAALAIGLVNLFIGLILGVLAAIGLGVVNTALAQYAGLVGITVPVFSGMAAALLIIAYPISGFIVGFLGTLIVAAIYNLIARKVPLRVELK